jgi:hypothetical protein
VLSFLGRLAWLSLICVFSIAGFSSHNISRSPSLRISRFPSSHLSLFRITSFGISSYSFSMQRRVSYLSLTISKEERIPIAIRTLRVLFLILSYKLAHLLLYRMAYQLAAHHLNLAHSYFPLSCFRVQGLLIFLCEHTLNHSWIMEFYIDGAMKQPIHCLASQVAYPEGLFLVQSLGAPT